MSASANKPSSVLAANKARWLVALVASPQVGVAGLIFGVLLVDYVSKDGRAWPSQETLAKKGVVSPRTIRRGRKEVELAGFLIVERNSSNTCYPILDGRLLTGQLCPVPKRPTPTASKRPTLAPNRPTPVIPTGQGCPPNLLREPLKNLNAGARVRPDGPRAPLSAGDEIADLRAQLREHQAAAQAAGARAGAQCRYGKPCPPEDMPPRWHEAQAEAREHRRAAQDIRKRIEQATARQAEVGEPR